MSAVDRDELESALVEADSLMSLVGYRYADRVRGLGQQFPPSEDLPAQLIAASSRCRGLAKRLKKEQENERPEGTDEEWGDERECTHCGGNGECDANANPLWDCDDQPHPCHACGGSGLRRDQRIF